MSKYKETEDVIIFETPGCGFFKIRKNPKYACGDRVGFSIGINFDGSEKFAGGVMGRDDAKVLAEFILKSISETPETEEEEYKRRFPKRFV